MRTIGILFLCTAAMAQQAPAPLKLGNIIVTGSIRARAYGWDWFEASTGTSNYAYSGNLLRLNLFEKRKGMDWGLDLAAPVLLGLPDNATAPAPQGALGLGSNYYSANANSRNSAMVFAKQAFIRIKGLGASDANTLQLGRFEFNDGTELIPRNATLAVLKRDRISQRLIGTFGFTDVGRSFDGAHYAFTRGATGFNVVAATPTRGVFQTDGWGWNRAAFGYAAFTRDWGHGRHSADTRVFALEYGDWRNVLKTDSRALAVRRGDLSNIRIETFGGHSIHAFTTKAGTLDAVVWGAAQTGKWGTQAHRAYSFDAEGGLQPAWSKLKPLKPWIRGGFTIGSGDSNPNDATHGTFFQVLPTPRPYARFPFFNMMNTEDRFAALILRPHAKVTVSSEFHALRLSNASDLWYAGGGVFQPWTFGYIGRPTSGKRSLGNLYDTSVEFRATRQASFTAYYGRAQGLATMRQIYPKGKDAGFGYIELLYRF
ncbi:MAG: hypothetical protein HY820_19640 [Acidobacteria bacterium]|nr:hypothetical protein [Acidobacteriota bacterium]